MKKIIASHFILIFLFSFKGWSQYRIQQSMTAFRTLSTNMGWAGDSDALQFQLQHRIMWTGLDGAPETSQLFISAPIRNKKTYLTGSILKDEIGLTRTSTYLLGGVYKVLLTKNKSLRFSLSAGLQQSVYDGNGAIISQQNDPEILLQRTAARRIQMAASALYTSPSFYLGLQLPHLVSDINTTDDSPIFAKHLSGYNYQITTGYRWSLRDQWKLHAGLSTYKIPRLSHQTTGFLMMEGSALKAGLGYRYQDALQLLLHWGINDQFTLTYAYDHPTSAHRPGKQGSHEWMLTYLFSYNNKVPSPRTL
jgi:type IX secretion system PorP/SprF family membrane protein